MSLAARAECLLFVAGDPLPLAEIARALALEPDSALQALRELDERLTARQSGLHVVELAGGFQLATRPEHAEAVARLLARSSSKLSRAALETLAIVAYRQPVTVPEIEAVRGVASGGVARALVEKRLIAEVGRRPTVGRPVLYATTPEFLHYFALRGLEDLPPLDEPRPPSSVPSPSRGFEQTAEPARP
ncbi:MAG: SMC-Scp complex subunit ScpB [Chthonomonadales bacterium]|nr:SMC-Scp complex subunit ScpB [Chthonomonadales bacterium]